MNRPSLIEVHVSAPDAVTADQIAGKLVRRRLAACVQVIPEVRTTYAWEGEVEHDTECLLLIKTAAHLFDQVRECVQAEHPYEVPEVLAVPVHAVNDAYAGWLAASVRDAQ